ncbi:MAG: hydrogenase expression/formation protein HypE [Bacteroides sp.]|jgi:hydrogenase expression/formation protein HypE|nr:hydrogenase expression/formation protein HypE [Bacteroides sp.]
MKEKTDSILLSHGSGGSLMHELVRDVFIKHFDNAILGLENDAAVFKASNSNIAFTTDSFVVDPVFFPGGDIGKLAICGTINDLVAVGAKPYCLSAGFILEEGFPLKELERIVANMATIAKLAGVFIAAGDTKVVEKGKCDKIFINTSGIGVFPEANVPLFSKKTIKPGDQIIINGFLGDHGMAVIAARNELEHAISFQSDCAPLNLLLGELLKVDLGIKFMRDPTRGGLATTLCEICEGLDIGIKIFEDKVPVRASVQGLCDLLGFDPLYVANEGKMLIVAKKGSEQNLLSKLRKNPLGRNAAIIGEVISENKGLVTLQTSIGGTRIVNMLSGEQLPRIC